MKPTSSRSTTTNRRPSSRMPRRRAFRSGAVARSISPCGSMTCVSPPSGPSVVQECVIAFAGSASEADLADQVLRVHAVLLEDVRVQLVVDLLGQLLLELLRLLALALLLERVDDLLLGDLHVPSFLSLVRTSACGCRVARGTAPSPR